MSVYHFIDDTFGSGVALDQELDAGRQASARLEDRMHDETVVDGAVSID